MYFSEIPTLPENIENVEEYECWEYGYTYYQRYLLYWDKPLGLSWFISSNSTIRYWNISALDESRRWCLSGYWSATSYPSSSKWVSSLILYLIFIVRDLNYLKIFPFLAYLSWLLMRIRLRVAKRSDERNQIIQEVLSAIKVVKMYVWENFFMEKITKTRKYARKIYYNNI